MLLKPKITKYKKVFKGRVKGLAVRTSVIRFGKFGLRTLEPARLTAKQIEAIKKTILKLLKKKGKLWVRIFPDIPVTAKPIGVRMGSGKGNVDYWCARVKKGNVLFEIDGVDESTAKKIFKIAGNKLPVNALFIKRFSISDKFKV
jgi:large subunit ribosomal protein L16